MSKVFNIDFIEQKKDLLFVAGTSQSPLAVGEIFTVLLQNGKPAKGSIALKLESIFVAGEPLEMIEAHQGVLLALSGDGQALIDAATALQWQKKGGRLLRNSEIALSLESDET